MKLLWTWSGKFFGYLENDVLRTQDGRHVGQLHDEEIYGPNGVYLGELMNESRLISALASAAIETSFSAASQNMRNRRVYSLLWLCYICRLRRFSCVIKRERNAKFRRRSPGIPLQLR